MKRIILLMASLLFAFGMPFVGTAADVNININVPPPPPPPPAQEAPPPVQPIPEAPPPLEFAGPPDVVVVPSGTRDVYLVPNMVGLYFYEGYWYRFYGNNWFRASLYSGPWVTIGMTLVPAAVVVIPPDYILALPPGYHRIHYGDFHSHWRDWGRSRYWHGHDWYRDHSTHRWGGREFHKPPPGHPGDRWIRGKGPGVKGDGKRPGGKGPEVKGGGRGPYDKGPGIKGGGRPGGAGPGGGKIGGAGPGGPGPGGGSPGGMKPGGAWPKTGPPGKPE